jgi:hypothetical protein
MNKVPDERYESAAQMHGTLIAIRAALSGAGDEATQRLGIRWTPLPGPVLTLITQAPMKWRIAVLSALALVVALLLFSPAPPAADTMGAPRAAPPGPVASQIPLVSLALSTRRDSALAARDRAVQAGALKNNVPAMALAETMFQVSEQALQAGNQSQALNGYVAVVEQYRKAHDEARTLQQEAAQMLQRVTPARPPSTPESFSPARNHYSGCRTTRWPRSRPRAPSRWASTPALPRPARSPPMPAAPSRCS